MTDILVTEMGGEQLHAVVDLITAQQARHYRRDPRLRGVRTREHLEALVTQTCQSDEPPLVALDIHGRVSGYAQPAVWELTEQSLLRAFLTARSGTARHLVLPNPLEEDAHAVASTLVAALSQTWERHHTSGDLIRWPSADAWLEPVLHAYGFRLDSVCAAHPPHPLVLPQPPLSPSVRTRSAQPEDEEVLVELLQEELRFHERYTPFVRSSPTILTAFRRKLARLWASASLEEGAPMVLVMEHGRDIVAMAQHTLLIVKPDDEPGYTPPGWYGCIDNVSVREELRGQGIGRLLLQAVFDAFAATGLHLDGYLLWYNPDNPQAGRFWLHMGFQPLWTTYQRLHTESGSE